MRPKFLPTPRLRRGPGVGLENFEGDRKVHEEIKYRRHDERRGHVTINFDIHAVLCVCDFVVIVQRIDEQQRGRADGAKPKSCENMANESLLEKHGMDTFEKEIGG